MSHLDNVIKTEFINPNIIRGPKPKEIIHRDKNRIPLRSTISQKYRFKDRINEHK